MAASLAAIFAFALWLRVEPVWPHVFRDGRVLLLSNDPWIHARQVDQTLATFPRLPARDAHRLFPGGQANEAPLFPVLLASAAWVLGGGAPSPELVDKVLAWAPAFLGALVIWPVFAIGRRLMGTRAGVLAAAIVAVLPGQLLQRSLLGFTDHHVAECLLSLLVLASLAAAMSASAKRQEHWSVVAGAWLGLYLLNWGNGMVLPLALSLWAVVQIILERGLTRRTPLAAILTRAFVVAFLLVLPAAGRESMRNVLPSLAVCLALVGVSHLSLVHARKGHGQPRTWLAVAGAAGTVLLLAAWVMPEWAGDLGALLRRLAPRVEGATIAEARPLLFPTGPFTLAPFWDELSTSSLLGAAGLLWLMRRVMSERRPADSLLVVWTLVALGLTLGQVRFGYYLAPVAALLASAAVFALTRGLAVPFAALAAFCLALYPAFSPALAVARSSAPGPSKAWVETLDWMRANTEDPTATTPYGVLAWCDYGYWITRLGARIPVANPTQHGATEVARFLLETDEVEARRQIEKLGARYLLLNRDLLPEIPEGSGLIRLGLLDTLARWAGRNPSDFYEVVFEYDGAGARRATVLYTPEYYRTMLVRLYVFGGKASEPDEARVIESATASGGRPLRGRHPLRSGVPLPPLTGFSAVYSTQSHRVVDGRRIPEIVVFDTRM